MIGVLLGGDHQAGLLGGGDDGLDVERLERRHVQDVRVDTLLLQGLGRLDGAPQHDAGGHDGHVAALAHDHGGADPEVVVVVEDDRAGVTGEAQVDGTVVLGDGEDRLARLDAVARRHDGHVGHGPHDGHVLHGLVRLAALAHEQVGVGADDDHVEARLRDRDPDLVEGALGGEAGEGVW